jgi:hypothetical protein
VTEEEYDRARRIAQAACRGRRLSTDEWRTVEQDAAVEAWQSGNATRIWWAAVDSAIKLQGTRRKHKAPQFVTFSWDGPSSVDVEAEVIGRVMADEMLAKLSTKDAAVLSELVLLDRTPADVCVEWGVADSTVGRRRDGAIERLRALVANPTT